MTSGDLSELAQLLADDAVLYADGGGKRAAVLDPVRGKENILGLFARIAAARRYLRRDQLERASINGLPGFIVHAEDGVQTTAFEGEGDQMVTLYVVRNPDKLRHLAS
jgi:RNA polymerase sigma-70 factor (ECF subfamily)